MNDRRLLMLVTITLALAMVAFGFGFIDLFTEADWTPSQASTVTGK